MPALSSLSARLRWWMLALRRPGDCGKSREEAATLETHEAGAAPAAAPPGMAGPPVPPAS